MRPGDSNEQPMGRGRLGCSVPTFEENAATPDSAPAQELRRQITLFDADSVAAVQLVSRGGQLDKAHRPSESHSIVSVVTEIFRLFWHKQHAIPSPYSNMRLQKGLTRCHTQQR